MSRRQPEKPEGDIAAAGWGSDAIAQMLRRLDVGYVALNPGSSFRGLHDSLVNHLGNADPQMLLCLHEEHAIAIAHGWAKVTGKPMAVFLHANVGLMHASMAIYNAWCDRVPMLIFGATGPVDADKRRPWIDWIHTSRDQAALVRPFVKWDDQPASLEASLASMMRADMITRTVPEAPVYVCFDVSVQEAAIVDQPKLPNPVRFQRPRPPAIPPESLEKLCTMLREAKSPIILMGRVGRDPLDWAYRLAMAEYLKARVLTDIKTGAAFPTGHPLHTGGPGFFLSSEGAVALSNADLILCIDWVDPAGTLKQAQVSEGAKVIQISMDHQLSNGWSSTIKGWHMLIFISLPRLTWLFAKYAGHWASRRLNLSVKSLYAAVKHSLKARWTPERWLLHLSMVWRENASRWSGCLLAGPVRTGGSSTRWTIWATTVALVSVQGQA